MTKNIISLIAIAVIGTSTCMAKPNTKPVNNAKPRMEMRNDRHHDMKPEAPHRHEFAGRHNKCRICHLTEHRIHEMERNMHMTPAKPMPKHGKVFHK